MSAVIGLANIAGKVLTLRQSRCVSLSSFRRRVGSVARGRERGCSLHSVARNVVGLCVGFVRGTERGRSFRSFASGNERRCSSRGLVRPWDRRRSVGSVATALASRLNRTNRNSKHTMQGERHEIIIVHGG
jgi:hypothetical protein